MRQGPRAKDASSISKALLDMEMTNRSPTSSRVVWLIIAGLAATVVTPILMAAWPAERAKWLLAAASNAVEFSKEPNDQSMVRAREYLAKAKTVDPGIVQNHDYLWVEFKTSSSKEEWVAKTLAGLPIESRPAAGRYLSSKFMEQGQFDLAYETLKVGISDLKKLDPNVKNELAYFASLADRDLDEALALVESAIREQPNSEYLDTKAWVLYRLGEFEEALVMIEAAEADLDKQTPSWTTFSAEASLMRALDEAEPPFVPSEKKPTEEKGTFSVSRSVAARIHAKIVYRYHKAEILKKLGKTEEAEAQFDWLRQRGFDDFAKLY